MVQPQIDLLLGYVAPGVDDIVQAKQEYFEKTGGEVHEDDRCFESRMQAFFNWYLLDRKQGGDAPVLRFLQDRGAALKAHDKDVIMGLTHSRLGLFEYRGKQGFCDFEISTNPRGGSGPITALVGATIETGLSWRGKR